MDKEPTYNLHRANNGRKREEEERRRRIIFSCHDSYVGFHSLSM